MKKILLLFAFMAHFSIVHASLQPGDIVILGFNSAGDDQITVMATRSFSNESFGITDSGMMPDGRFRAGEGYLSTRSPMSMTAGQILTISLNDGTAGTAEFSMIGVFDLAASGDQIIIFTGAYASGTCIYALNYNARNWISRDDSSSSALPQGLTNGQTAVCLVNRACYRYAQYIDVSHGDFLDDLGDFNNWYGSISHVNLSFIKGNVSHLGPGDFSVIAYNDKITEDIVFLALRNISAGTAIKITDKGWNGGSFYPSEGTLTYIVPTGGVRAGQAIRYSPSNTSFYQTEKFGLSTNGDQLIIYQGPESGPRFISALNTRGAWAGSANTAQTSVSPAVPGPDEIPVVRSFTQAQGNGYYNGTHTGTLQDILRAIADPVNYVFAGGYNQSVIPAISAFVILTSVPAQSFRQCVPFSATASTDQNYISTRIFKTAGINPDNLTGLTTCEVNETIQYFDGLGRPLQAVQVQGSPGFKDIVKPVAYDAFGREKYKYQPYASQTGTTGSFRNTATGDQVAFYNTPTAGIKATAYPFAETVFESSPLNRLQQQGAPGEAWQIGGGHTVKAEYGTNLENEVKLWAVNDTDNGAGATVYGPGKLYKTVSRDENWKLTDLKAGTTEEFKDFEGRVVLKRIWETAGKSLSTYYVYDDLGNLRYVLPPAVNENGQSPINSFDESQPVFDEFIYGYHYDGRKRMIEKKIPGKGWELIVYNKLDQMVMSQDANQRSKSPQEWNFSKYDSFGRIVISGRYIDNVHNGEANTNYLSYFQGLANGTAAYERRDASNTQTGYSNDVIPQGSIGDYYVLNYYDDYDFPGNSFGAPTGNQAPKERTRSLLTGSKVKNLGNGTMLLTVNYYDLEGRVVQSKSSHQMNGADVVDNTYSFIGELTASTRTHTANGVETAIDNRYEYDHMGRKIATFENINSQGEVALSHLEYNEIGQLAKKNLHNDVQATTFGYNERGWLKNSTSDQFSMKLDYEDGVSQGYNGNITRQYWDWSNAANPTANIFNYSYDKLNRLGSASTVAGVSMSEALTYDVMGNIASLDRDGAGPKAYNYYSSGNSNRLQNVSGLTTQDYEYDANGNSTKDGLNGFRLTYNYLNLPATAIRTTGTPVNLSYTYDASGNKLAKTSNGSVRNYIGGIEYKPDGSIDIIHTEEGVAQNNGGTYTYHYNLSDHLGNVRYTFDVVNGLISPLQKDDYYAFGKRNTSMQGSVDNKYLYNGKEIQEELGQYDYGARFYDPIIGRWNGIDAKAEKFHQFSPYSYAINNPLSYIDTDGRDIIIAFTGGPTGGGKTVDAKTGDAGTTGKVIRDAQKFADDHRIELQSRVITPGWTSGSSVKNALGFIKENYSKGEKVILYGYSYGGDFAVELSEALKEEGITVDLLVTVDASDGPLQNSSVNTIIPDNVKENQNFYQSNDSGRSSASQTSSGSSKKNKSADSGTTNSPGSNGGPNKSSDSKKTKVRNHYKKGSDLEHGNIDEKVNKDVKKYIEKVLGGS
ncbi:RHS repeat-associated protein [Pedobacter sp. W3I1]|uniref:DUF6443 domain-containing protein n=1 Tax=Pedobacter sp. W3I1 TaxID=3042291 RepID=UPI002785DCB7|nr:DUF6443 domain-containing protein [Pedobacter sp. W3I1]MDQ0636544.1 RHS repeat-associated protein [Pedobacter sp. W3I1]